MSYFNDKQSTSNAIEEQYLKLTNASSQRMNSQFFSEEENRAVVSMESLGGLEADFARNVSNFRESLRDAFSIHNHSAEENGLTPAMESAAAIGALLATNPRNAFTAAPARQPVINETNRFIPAQGSHSRVPAMEAYDERENRETVIYSALYNANAPKQDQFAEAFFPSVVVSPDQLGFTISMRLINVQNDFKHNLTGNVVNQFGRKNIIQALIDPSILRSELTKCVPVLRDENKTHFVEASLIPPENLIVENEEVTTSFLKVGKPGNLISLSTTDALLKTGLMNTSDALDPSVMLQRIAMKLSDTEVISFDNLDSIPEANFVPGLQGNYRKMVLQLSTNNLRINQKTKLIDGSASTVLSAIVAAKASVRLSVRLSGDINVETGDYTIDASSVTVHEIKDEQGNVLSLTTGQGKTFADALANAAVVGFKLSARRTLSNFRQRGLMLDLTRQNMVYGVPLLAPITVARTLTSGDQNDAADLGALVSATHIQMTNDAIATVLKAEKFLEAYVETNGSIVTEDSEMLGAGRLLVSPYFKRATIDASTDLDSLTSSGRAGDIQSLLVNKVRDLAYNMFRDTGYKAAADMLAGGVATKPTVIVGTDPVIAAYLNVVGDTRTLGNEFDVRVVSTLNKDMKGKIIITFGQFDTNTGVPNPLHFGNAAWKPEITAILPLHRGGANSKEVIVQPSYLHVVNLPVMASVTVKNLDVVAGGKVEIHNSPTQPRP